MIYIKRKCLRKVTGRKFFYIVFFVIMIYLFGYFISFFMHKKIDSTTIEYADSDNPKIICGIIVRDEKIYTAKKSGLLSINLYNNDVAKKNCTVCTIQNKNFTVKLEDDLSQVNNDILAMQKKRTDISFFQTDIKNANAQIKKIIDDNIYLCAQNDTAKINNIFNVVQKNMDLKNQILLTENRGNIKEMDEKKKSIEQEIKKNTENITAVQSGLVSYLIDGMENNFTVAKINDLTSEQLNIKSVTKEFFHGASINKNDAVFKIIESNDWYIISDVKNKDIENLKEGDVKLIYVEYENNFVPIETYVHKILVKNKNESMIALKSTRFVQDFLASRNIKFKLEDTNQHGFKIPVSSVTKKNLFKIFPQFVTKSEVYTVTKKNGEAAQIKIYDSDENYFYAESENLSAKDIIISNEKTFELEQTKKIRGVFVANTGIAEFKKINYADDLPQSGFIILEPKINPYIKISDRIITDATKVFDGKKIIEH